MDVQELTDTIPIQIQIYVINSTIAWMVYHKHKHALQDFITMKTQALASGLKTRHDQSASRRRKNPWTVSNVLKVIQPLQMAENYLILPSHILMTARSSTFVGMA
ncbi:unnamed protein product [Acanthoscelides obtectus]|uniref:Uncharacterized protein n=1 Tax=Acanthoscelides obtectus TaxID=200917 RepID=A0A9P0K159_ACAOB|nr:unnamed protein product [Acanthoscelides obtectus]CAK1625296.1 hypothetical protein AOBTE_LOCUS3092 [Acanthoscelides obtectus]